MIGADNLQRIAHVVRGIAADGVEKANSGHPGLPLGCAEIGSTLFFDILQHNPKNPEWANRDRFVLSGGHGSMLLYTLLHLTGYNVSMDDLKSFRQLNSNTPGHPEYRDTDGVETTTGPLGQGIANAVGMAIAERMTAARFNRPGFEIVDNYTYALAGDGDFMEGVSAEASSYAGHLKLGKLILIYDSNGITIEGETDLTFTESVKDRYVAYGWHVQEIDGHNISEIQTAIINAQKATDKPSLIVARTEIAKGAPTKVNTAAAHGAPLGEDEVRGLKEAIGLPVEQEFYVPDDFASIVETVTNKGQSYEREWEELFTAWGEEYPELKQQWLDWHAGKLPADIDDVLTMFSEGTNIATRAASGQVLNSIATKMQNLVGGSADLAPSNNTYMKEQGDIKPGDFAGRNFNFGVREHGMGAILNGMILYGPFRVFGGTFLVFSDYMRPSMRLAALMGLPVVYVMTHDSIFVGEDGPTHQPVEHTESLRLIPNLQVYRPADAEETAWAWVEALKRTDGPSCLVLTRQALPFLPKPTDWDFTKGGYIVRQESKSVEIILAATGSEVSLSVQAAEIIEQSGVGVRVVSVPCMETLAKQSSEYTNRILPSDVPTLVVEMGVTRGWYSLRPGGDISVYGLDEFGMSGPGQQVAEHFKFTPEHVAKKALEIIKK